MGPSWLSIQYFWHPFLLCVSMTSTEQGCISRVERLNGSTEFGCEHKERNAVWKKNYTLINGETAEETLTYKENFFNLTLKNLRLQDEGVYSCSIWDHIVASYCLTIEAAPEMSIHSNKLTQEGIVWVKSGDTLNVTCKAIGARPKVNISWMLYNEKSEPEHRKTTTVQNEVAGLFDTISNISHKVTADLRYLVCLSEGQRLTNQSRSINVSVYGVPVLRIVHNGNNLTSPFEASLNIEYHFQCVAFGSSQEVELNWKVNNISQEKRKQVETINLFNNDTADTSVDLILNPTTSTITISCFTSFSTSLLDVTLEINAIVDVHVDNLTSLIKWCLPLVLVGGFLSIIILLVWKRVRATITTNPTSQDNRQVPEVCSTPDDYAECKFTSKITRKDAISGKVLDSGQSEDITDAQMKYTLQRKDVIIKSTLLGGSFLKYSTAYNMTEGEQKFLIARSVKDDSTVKDIYDFMKMADEILMLPQHPNIVMLLGICKEEMPYYTYHEYVNGGSVRDHLLRNYQSSRLSRRFVDYNYSKHLETDAALELYSFANDVANGMEFLSTHKFCHPALSARKVLLGTDRVCKLYDIWPFELALQQIKHLMNKKNPPTPWIAPETMFIEQYSDKSDVWSFGMFLWELYSFGEIPYKSMTREEIEQELRNNQHLKLPRDCPGAISNLILSSWNKDAGRRPSFTEMRQELQSLRHFSLEVKPDLPTKMALQTNGKEIVDGGDQHDYFSLCAEENT